MRLVFLIAALLIAPACRAADNEMNEQVKIIDQFIADKKTEGHAPQLTFSFIFNNAVGQLPRNGVPVLTAYLDTHPSFLTDDEVKKYQERLAFRVFIPDDIG